MIPLSGCVALAAAVALAPADGGGSPGGAPAARGDGGSPARRTLRLHGAASVVDSLVKPHLAAVEAATGLALAVDRSNAGQGLRDLVEGRCDVALASASLDATVAAARSAGLTGAVPDLRMAVAATSEVVFVVHPSNPVRKLSWAQLRDVHTGKIASWKELGGPDRPIAVVTDAAASATRGLVKATVLGGAEYAPSARAMPIAEVVEAVAKDPAAIGAVGREFAEGKGVAIVESQKVERPLAFVTVGPPSGDAAAVIRAFEAEAKRGGGAR